MIREHPCDPWLVLESFFTTDFADQHGFGNKLAEKLLTAESAETRSSSPRKIPEKNFQRKNFYKTDRRSPDAQITR
jgi:hypothetical protein